MFYVYILLSRKDLKTYIGYTDNINRRLLEHNNGHVKATKNRRPLRLVYLECFFHMADAKNEELYLKSGYGRSRLKKLLKMTFKDNI